MQNGEKPICNPHVLLREEFDDWAVLFDPDTGRGFGLNPTGVYVWKLLDGSHTIDEILEALRRDALHAPHESGEHLIAFLEELTRDGLAAYEAEKYRRRLPSRPVCASENVPDALQLTYETPRLVNLNSQAASGAQCDCSCTGGSQTGTGECHSGGCGIDCYTGSGAGTYCSTGSYASGCDAAGTSGPWCNAHGNSPYMGDCYSGASTSKCDSGCSGYWNPASPCSGGS
jgi:SynChlorMet cassette protein ScmD